LLSLKWCDSLVIGHREIDYQHKEILKKMRDIYNMILFHDKRTDILRHIKLLRTLARDHMAFEESYMAVIGHKDIENHRLAHREELTRFDHYIKKFEDDDLMLTTDIMILCKEFFYDHVLKNDSVLKEPVDE